MLNRELQDVVVNTLSVIPDEYGQTRNEITNTRTVKMVCKRFKDMLNNSPAYNEFDYICLTEDSSIALNDQLVFDNANWNVKYIIPSKRWNQVFVSKA